MIRSIFLILIGNMNILQYHVYLINLDPTVGYEIKKIRPCLVISPNEMNLNIITVIIAPMTTKSHKYPTRVPLTFKGKKGWIILDQIRTIDKIRIIKEVGKITEKSITDIKHIIKEMLVD
jgi:mRNA interferase MazF